MNLILPLHMIKFLNIALFTKLSNIDVSLSCSCFLASLTPNELLTCQYTEYNVSHLSW